ncbi:phage minor head protein [Streptomyces sp. NBC_00425]|uniref:phage minor head protein n=1 Tax=Streptomyces sp. NBC_00425 TaxID=2975740 RepID=UPI002E1C118C
MDEETQQALDAAEEAVAAVVAEVLAEVADEFAQGLDTATEIVAARFSVSSISRLFRLRVPRIVRRLLGVTEQAAQQTADDVDAELPETWTDLPERHDEGRELPDAVASYVTVTEHLLNAVGDRLAEAAREELAAGVDAGEDMEQLRARLRARFAREAAQLGDAREERIARTEAGRAWNTAVLGAAQAVEGPDRPLVKQWVARRDSRVRHDHDQADGQLRLLSESFTVGGVLMTAPHDPTAPAGQVVNCRCVLRVHPEVRAAALDPQLQARGPAFESTEAGSLAAADDGSHLMGGMIALVPTDDDAARLALPDGEAVEELHLTLWFLGGDASTWTADQRNELIGNLQTAAADLGGPVQAHLFGVNHWNPGGDDPCWVWAVGDAADSGEHAPTLDLARKAATVALEDTHERPELPAQHSPWHAHMTGVYTQRAWPLEEMVAKVGPVTFDRIRVAFGGDHTDIPLAAPQEDTDMAENNAAAATEAAPAPTVRTWSNPDETALAFEDQETGDGRLFTSGALYWENGPWPLQYADEMGMGHDGAELAGAISEMGRDGQRLTGAGPLYITRPAGADAVQLLEEGSPLGVSVDLDSVDVEFVDRTITAEDDSEDVLFASAHVPSMSVMRMEDGSYFVSAATAPEWTADGGGLSRQRHDVQIITNPGGVVPAEALRAAFGATGVLTAAAGDADDDSGMVVWTENAGDLLMRITRARVRGATLVAMPAFAGARIVLDPVDEETAAAAPALDLSAASDTHEAVIAYVRSSPIAVGAREVASIVGITMEQARGHLNRAAKAGTLVRLAPGQYTGASSMPEGEETAAAVDQALEELAASAWTAMRDLPPMPAAWFAEPTTEELPPGSGGVHYKDGRVYGWVAQAGVPHAGYPGKDLTIEKLAKAGLDTTHFLRQKFVLDDGSTVRCGTFTMNVPHRRDGAECEDAACQFDDSRTVAGVVTCGMSDGGMWFSGAAAPWLSEWDMRVFLACQPSYHLKQAARGRGWELRAVLTVPVPGHSSALVAAAVERANLALVASAVAADTVSGQDPDDVQTTSASSDEEATDLGGQRPDDESGWFPDASEVAEVVVATMLTSPEFLDRLNAALETRVTERGEMDAEIERLAAQMDPTTAELAAAAVGGHPEGDN